MFIIITLNGITTLKKLSQKVVLKILFEIKLVRFSSTSQLEIGFFFFFPIQESQSRKLYKR